jgi:alpha-tubulin suppressor-like RCC1 family protein
MENIEEIGGEVYTWGSGEMGQLGLSPIEITKLAKDSDGFPFQSIPASVKTLNLLKIVQVAGGDGHSLAVTNNGKVYAWGASACGQLGLSKIEEMPKDSEGYPYHPEPRLIESLGDLVIIMVACGDAHSAALTSDGLVLTWGGGGCGQLGHPDTTLMPKDEDGCPFQPEPRVVESLNVSVRHICCGKAHTVAVTEEGLLYTWGAGACGQLGHPDTSVFPFDEDGYPYHPTPKLVAALKYVKLTMAACGDVHTLVLSEDGAIYCFGGGSFGQLGLGVIKNLPVDVDDCPFMPVPKQIENLRKLKIVYIGCGDSHSVALTYSGEVYIWGAAACGQLGLEELDFLPRDADDSPYQPFPSLVAKLKGKVIVSVACGEAHTLVLTNAGIVYSFGASNCGQLGIPSQPPDNKVRIPRHQRESEHKILSCQPVPKLISSLLSKKVYSIACGGVHNIIVTDSPPKSITMDLYKYYKQPQFTDFTFIVKHNTRDEALQCHKVVIASRSQYLRSQIASISSLQLEYSKRVVSKLLDYFYLDDIEILTESITFQGFSQLLEYLSFAHKFQLNDLVEVCQSFLMQKLRPYIPDPLPIQQEGSTKGLLFLPDGRAAILHPDSYNKMLSEAIILENHSNFVDVPIKKQFCLGSNLVQELNNKDLSDVILMVEGKPIYSHRVILASRSQYFSALYSHGFREAKEGVVEIGGVAYDEMLSVLKYLYCDDIIIDLKAINELLTMCERFSLVSLKIRCELALISSLNIENAALLFRYSKTYSCGRLKECCLVYMQEYSEEILKTSSIEDLDKDSLLEIMRYLKS